VADADGFPRGFDDELAVGPEEGNRAFFGGNVLRGLVEGIDDFIQVRQRRWHRRSRSLGPVLLGSAMWIDDRDLIEKIRELSAACIVVTKQGRRGADHKLPRLIALNERTPGMPIRAFAELSGLAPRVAGSPAIVGPDDLIDDVVVPTIRTLGYRRVGKPLVPLVHAKLALLGDLWWHDEGPDGHVDDVIGFTPRRLWVTSANFTRASRANLEFGYWTEDPLLVEGAKRFLLKLMASSEGLDPAADVFEPDLAPVEFDDEAMAEAFAELRWDESDDPLVEGG
jgi:hypothetical protein